MRIIWRRLGRRAQYFRISFLPPNHRKELVKVLWRVARQTADWAVSNYIGRLLSMFYLPWIGRPVLFYRSTLSIDLSTIEIWILVPNRVFLHFQLSYQEAAFSGHESHSEFHTSKISNSQTDILIFINKHLRPLIAMVVAATPQAPRETVCPKKVNCDFLSYHPLFARSPVWLFVLCKFSVARLAGTQRT